MKKKLLLFLMCAVLAFTLAGCGNDRVESTVSDVISEAGDDIDGAMSRVESAVESIFDGDDRDNGGNDDAMRDESSPLFDEESSLSSGRTRSESSRAADGNESSTTRNVG